MDDSNRTKLMWASFLTLVASGAGFAVRTAMGGIWGSEFNIDGQQFGQILGAGFLGFGLMIFFGGILTEKFGYKKLLIAAFVLHLISGFMLFFPRFSPNSAFTILFWSAFLFSIAQGLYEAVINPLIAQLYPENKTHYLNILHAGWPGGMIIGGITAACFVGDGAWIATMSYWEIPLTSFIIFLLAYAVLALPEKFPDTVGESTESNWGLIFSCFMSPVFLFLIFLHACIGYVELGVDSWITKLMENLMENPVIVLVYTSFLMFILRFFAGPIVHKINPIGLLFFSAVVGCLGLLWLGSEISSVAVIFVAATFYSLGKAFFWPTMLGVAGERYPQSGSVGMGALGAAGMLTVGLIAGEAIGYKQAINASTDLKNKSTATYERYAGDEKGYLFFSKYNPLIPKMVSAANSSKKKSEISDIKSPADGDEYNLGEFLKIVDADLGVMALKEKDKYWTKMATSNKDLIAEISKKKQEGLPETLKELGLDGNEDLKASLKAADWKAFETGLAKATKAIADKKEKSKEDEENLKTLGNLTIVARTLYALPHAHEDIPLVQETNLSGGRKALTITAAVPAIMAIGFLILIIYFRSIGGYKVLEVAKDGTLQEVKTDH